MHKINSNSLNNNLGNPDVLFPGRKGIHLKHRRVSLIVPVRRELFKNKCVVLFDMLNE